LRKDPLPREVIDFFAMKKLTPPFFLLLACILFFWLGLTKSGSALPPKPPASFPTSQQALSPSTQPFHRAEKQRERSLAVAPSFRFDSDARPLQGKRRLDCKRMPCASVLPGAVSLVPHPKGALDEGFDAKGKRIGWVFLSSDVVDIPAYSGKPMETLIGLDTKGVITGVRVIHHSEPILLVGIPEQVLHDFAGFYVGKRASQQIVVGRASEGALSVDVISGATVTALAQNKTILEAARAVGMMVGVIRADEATPGHFVKREEIWDWRRMEREGVWGRLTISERAMGLPKPSGEFVDLYYTIADAPQVGRSLLGERTYKHLMQRLKRGQHLLVIMGKGSSSFKGSAFVRGGIFDRVRVEQGLRELVFRDTDYVNLPKIETAGAPSFREGAVFLTTGAALDPGAPFSLIFLGSRYDGRGGFHREFRQFKSMHRLPRSVYQLEGPDPYAAMYLQAWRNRQGDAFLLGFFLLLVMGLFTARRFLTGDMKRLKWLHISVMLCSVVMIGFWMRAQPSITQVLTLVQSLVGQWRWALFFSEPLIFMMWIFIALVTVLWGRGVFCGWVCPFGAMTELMHKLGQALRFPSFELPDAVHRWARHLRYLVFAVLLVVFLIHPILGEMMAEIEPFKSTFLVYAWKRPWGFFLWWGVLLAISLFWWRPFCRYLCPLGAALALPSSFRLSGPKRRVFCRSCQICTKGCEPKAIRPDGVIDPRECLSCMECEATYRDEKVCPPLVGIARILEKAEQSEQEKARLARLMEQKKDV
jgi:NosR/NirI family nitrous oxide reductase transcriptional regulator